MELNESWKIVVNDITNIICKISQMGKSESFALFNRIQHFNALLDTHSDHSHSCRVYNKALYACKKKMRMSSPRTWTRRTWTGRINWRMDNGETF